VTAAAHRKLWARLALAAYVAVCGLWLLRLDYPDKISTNVLDLVPSDERSPELNIVRHLAGDVQGKVMMFAVSDPAHPQASPLASARELAAALRADPAFASVTVMGDSADQEKMGRLLYRLSPSLLLPAWLGRQERDFARTGLPAAKFPAWTAERSAAALESFLSRPEAEAMQTLILEDPLLLLPNLIDQARGLSPAAAPAGGPAMVWALTRDSPLAEQGQGPVFAAVDRAIAKVQPAHPGLTIKWTGVNRFAAASRRQIESEIKTLNLFSLLAVLAVACLFVRQIWKLLHLVPIILCSLLGAWTISTLVFERLHILVFVIGSLLSGVAIDYGFYIFMQPFDRPDEAYGGKLRRLLKPLLASCLTTVVGFSLLFFSELPLLRQMGVFVSAGLLTALGAAMVYFAQLDRPFLEGRRYGRLAAGASHPRARIYWRVAAGAAVLIAVLGPWRLHWRDDVRELDVPHPELQANDQEVRGQFGDRSDRPVYLTYGADLADARRHLAEFADFAGPGALSLGMIFPTEADYRAAPNRLRRLSAFPAEFRAALRRHGFLPDSFSAFFLSWQALPRTPPKMPYPQLYSEVDPVLIGPLGLLYSGGGARSPNALADPGAQPARWGQRAPPGPGAPPPSGLAAKAWFVSILDHPLPAQPGPALHTVNVNELQSLNSLFSQYRWSALRLSLIGLALVIASVFLIYPLSRAVRIALIPAGSCFFIFGVMGLAGLTLNLFNLLGAFLGVCLAHNYSIFSSETAGQRTAPPVPVRLSALCAAASFGVLALSHIPVVHALGLTVCLIVLTALASVELEPMVRR
jgi:predicted exporter